jgi:hypothetical protein
MLHYSKSAVLTGDQVHTNSTKESEDTSPDKVLRKAFGEEESLLSLFADTFCFCEGPNCKKELTNQFQRFMRSELSRKFVLDLINIIAGSSSKSDKIINILIYFLKYLSLNTIGKDVQDDMLNLFVMIYLKASRPLQRAVIDDLETIFFLIKEQETALFID